MLGRITQRIRDMTTGSQMEARQELGRFWSCCTRGCWKAGVVVRTNSPRPWLWWRVRDPLFPTHCRTAQIFPPSFSRTTSRLTLSPSGAGRAADGFPRHFWTAWDTAPGNATP